MENCDDTYLYFIISVENLLPLHLCLLSSAIQSIPSLSPMYCSPPPPPDGRRAAEQTESG